MLTSLASPTPLSAAKQGTRPRPKWVLLLAGLAGATGLSGCHYHAAYPEVREHRVFFNDFEQLDGWLPEASPTLTTERAHSGRYSIMVDAAHPFSITYHTKLGELMSLRPRRMRLSAWVWVESSSDDAKLVFSVTVPDDPQGKSKAYAQVFLVDNWPYRRWTHVSRDIDLPPEVSSQADLSIYLWNDSNPDRVFADDWELTDLH